MTLAAAILALSPKRFLDLQETAGTTAVDQGSAGQNSTYTNGVTLNAGSITPGEPSSTSASFDGTDDYVISVNAFDLAFADPNTLTFIGVFNVGTATGRRTLVATSDNNTASMPMFEVGGGGTRRLSAAVNGTFVAETPSNVVPDNTDCFAVYTRAGTGDTHTWWIGTKLDGLVKYTGAALAVHGTTAYVNGSQKKLTGARTPTSQRFSGKIRAVALIPTTVTDAQVRALFNAWLGAGTVTQIGTPQQANSASLPFTVPIPPERVAGDLLIVGAMIGDEATAITTPSGWTKAAERTATNVNLHQTIALFTKVSDGAETTFSVNAAAGTRGVAGSLCCTAGELAHVLTGELQSGSSIVFAEPQPTVDTTGDLLIYLTGGQTGTVGSSIFHLGADVTRPISLSDTAISRLGMGYIPSSPAGPAPAETTDTGNRNWAGIVASFAVPVPPIPAETTLITLPARARRQRRYPAATRTASGLVYLDTLATAGDPQITRSINGPDEANWTVDARPGLTHAGLTIDLPVTIPGGPGSRWTGRLDQPEIENGTLRAIGTAALLSRYYATADPGHPNALNHLDECVDNAIADGLPIIRRQSLPNSDGFAQSGTVRLDELLTTVADDLGKIWQVDDWSELRMFDVPTAVSYLLLATDAPAPTFNEYATTLQVLYVDDITTNKTVITVTDTTAAATFGVIQDQLDLTGRGAISAAAATSIGTNRLAQRAPRARWTEPFTVTPGQILSPGGVPVDLASIRTARLARLMLTDTSRSALADRGLPSTVLIGQLEMQGNVLAVSPVDTEGSRLRDLLARI